jgi:hypothetical protein
MHYKNEDRSLADLERQLMADAPELHAVFDTFRKNCETAADRACARQRCQDSPRWGHRLAMLFLLVGLVTTVAGAAVLVPLIPIGIALMLPSSLAVVMATRQSRMRRPK